MTTAPHEAPDVWLQTRDEGVRKAAFEALLRAHGGALRRTCRGHERDPQRSEELFQEVLVATWRAMPRFEGRSSWKTWLLRIANNVALSHAGRESRDPVQPVAVLPRALADSPGTDRIVDLARQRVRLLTAIQDLPPADRALLLLWLEGLSTREIAEATGLTTTNTTSRLSRLRHRLTRDLEDV